MNNATDLKMQMKLWTTLTNLGLFEPTLEYNLYNSIFKGSKEVPARVRV